MWNLPEDLYQKVQSMLVSGNIRLLNCLGFRFDVTIVLLLNVGQFDGCWTLDVGFWLVVKK